MSESPQTRIMLERLQLIATAILLFGSLIYVGKRSEQDEAQSRVLNNIASDITVMKERNADANAQIRVIGERVSQVEKRLERMEQPR
jgi:hypothetical protein